MNWKRPDWQLIFVSLLALVLLLVKIDKPFVGHHDWNGVFYGNVVSNTLKFGILKTKLGAVHSFLPQDPSEFRFYTHYPPIFRTGLALAASLLGVKEWSMRLTSALVSILGLVWFYGLVKDLWGKRRAFLASLFFILNPMFLYFAKMPVHEVFGLPLIILSIYAYHLYFKKPGRKRFWLLVMVLFLACQTVWSAYYLAPLLIIHHFVFLGRKKASPKGKKAFFKKKSWRFALIVLVPLICFLSHLVHTWVLTASWDNQLFKTMIFRMGFGQRAAKYSFSLLEYLKHETLWLSVYFTRVLAILSLLAVFLLVKKAWRSGLDFKAGLLVLMLVFPFIDLVIFRNVCFIHDYKLYYFLLCLPLLGAIGLDWLVSQAGQWLKFKNSLIGLGLILAVFGLFIGERLGFTWALLNTRMNQPAYYLGRLIREKTEPGEIVLLGSPSFAEFLDLFLNFYGQRKVVYFSPELKDFQQAYSSQAGLVVFVKGREKWSLELVNRLKQDYGFDYHQQFLIFDLKRE